MYVRARNIALAVLVFIVVSSLSYTIGKCVARRCAEKDITATDTLIIDVTHYDTVWRDNIAYKWRTVKDTVYVRGVGGDSIKAAVVSKEYAEDFTDHSENEYIAEALLNAGVRLCPETNTQEENNE